MTDGISALTSSPLGAYGLNMNGAYSSYPSMMSMYGMSGYGAGTYNPMFGSMGMMGMYSPEYLTQMANAQNQMEEMQLLQAQKMNQLMADGGLKANQHANKIFTESVLIDSSIKNLLSGLNTSIRNKDLENVCNYFDALKKQVIATHGEELATKAGKENINLAATEYIEALYTTEAQAYGKPNANLRDDIEAISETAFYNGFKCAMRPGHSTRDLKSTMNHCFGTEITEVEHDKSQKELGKLSGKVVHGASTGIKTGLITVGGGVGAAVLIKGLTLGHAPLLPVAKFMGKAGIVAACLATIIDIASPGKISSILGINSKQQATT